MKLRQWEQLTSYHASFKTTKVDFYCIFWWRNSAVYVMEILSLIFYNICEYAMASCSEKWRKVIYFDIQVTESSYGNLCYLVASINVIKEKKWPCFLFFMLLGFCLCEASWHNFSSYDVWRKLYAAHEGFLKTRHKRTAKANLGLFIDSYLKIAAIEIFNFFMKICYKNQSESVILFVVFS